MMACLLSLLRCPAPAPVVPPAFVPVVVTLTGRVVRLEPLGPEHADGLLLAGHHDALWRVTVQPPLVSADAVTRYLAHAAEQAAEQAAQRTLANTEAKYRQLVPLFEVLGAVRVQFKTDLRNTQSQRALEKLGAIREGVLRRHMVVRDGFVRDSVYYGITDVDWPGVKRRLQERLAAGV